MSGGGEELEALGADGAPTRIPAADAVQAYRSGAIRFAPGSRVPVRFPDGGVGDVLAEELDQAIDAGYQLAAPSELRSAELEAAVEDQGLATFVEGAQRSVSLGLTDVLAASDSPVLQGVANFLPGLAGASTPDDIEGVDLAEARGARRAANPGTALAGEVIGAVASAPIGGPGALAARGASRVLGTGLAGRLGAATIGGAVEGAVQGVGFELSDAAIDDAELTAESLASAAGQGAAMGFIAGGALSAPGEALRPLVGGLRKLANRSGLNRAIDEMGVAGLGGAGRATRAAMRREGLEAADVGRIVLEEKLVGPRIGPAEFGQRATVRARELAEVQSRAARVVDAAIDPTTAPRASAVRDRMRAALGDEPGPLLSRLRGRLVESGDDAAANVLDTHLAPSLARAEAPVGVEALSRLRRAVDEEILENAGAAAEPLGRLRQVLADDAGRLAQGVAPEARAAYDAATQRYGAIQWGRDLAKRSIKAAEERGPASKLARVGLPVGLAVLTGSPASVLAGVWLTGGVRRWMQTEARASLAAVGGDRIARAIGIRAATGQVQGAVRASAKALVGGSKQTRATRRALAPLADRYRDAVEDARGRSASPAAYDTRQPGTVGVSDISDISVEAAAMYAATRVRQAQALQARLPRAGGSLQPHLEEPGALMSDSERADFVRFSEAVRDPTAAVDEIAAGRGTIEHTDALREVYPRMYRELINTMTEELAATTEPLDHQTRLRIAALFPEVDPDPSLTGAAIARAQEAFLEAAGGAIGGAAGGGSPPSAAPGMSEVAATQAQRLEQA